MYVAFLVRDAEILFHYFGPMLLESSIRLHFLLSSICRYGSWTKPRTNDTHTHRRHTIGMTIAGICGDTGVEQATETETEFTLL